MDTTEFKIKVLDITRRQRAFFSSNATKDIKFRKEMLKKLRDSIIFHEEALYEAFWTDLHKSEYEAYLTEVSIVLEEINLHLKKLSSWAKPTRVRTPITLFPSQSRILKEPLGLALIVSPWNYPFQLIMAPLVGSISAGCCSVLKNSDYVPNISKVITDIITSTFNENYIAVFSGGREENDVLFNERFDLVFFTGSPNLGKVVMTAAANNLTPVILELGGQSPCIVDSDADIDIAARRITWGKFMNAGQTCISPDYLFVHEDIKDQLVERMKFYIIKYFGENAELSPDYGRIVNQKAFDRLSSYLQEGKTMCGGNVDRENLYIEPTIIADINKSDKIMQDEIFGPILPVMTFNKLTEVEHFIKDMEKPLAFYYFTKNRSNARYMLNSISSGGACINDVLVHIGNPNMPFGGVGHSGMGGYHGKFSFLAFSHQKSVVFSSTKIDLPLKYAPFKGKLKWLKRLI